MGVPVVQTWGGHRLDGAGEAIGAVNRFLEHLGVRGFSPATVRAYAFDLANFLAFLDARSLGLADVVASDLFDYLEWQVGQKRPTGKVVPLGATSPAPATVNRRVAAVRG